MMKPSKLHLAAEIAASLMIFSGTMYPAQEKAAGVGTFESHGDVGKMLHAGSVNYDAAKNSYTIAGSGENMWLGNDAFHFAWKKMSGEAVTLTADISFLGSGGNPHRKAVLMIRQSLDSDSVYADVALHGNGLAALQFRDDKGRIVNPADRKSFGTPTDQRKRKTSPTHSRSPG